MSDDDRMSVSTYTTDIGNDSTFKSPNISSRGRKRKPVIHDDGTELSYLYSPLPKRGRPKTPGKARGGGRRIGGGDKPEKRLANIDESSLFNVVKNGRNFEQMINKWMDEYDRIPDNAIVQVIQLLLHSCGCRGIITIQMINCTDYSDIIRQMADEFDDDCAEYPLIQSGQQWRKFRTNYENFLRLLIHKCRSGIIFDNRLMDCIIQMLTGLADSQVRAFRHTATFAAMKIFTALVDLVVQLVELADKTSLQIETEKAKLKQKGTNEQLEVLLLTKTEIDEKISDIKDMTAFLFKSVFVHRYRDVVSDIRCICITEMGNWMKVHPIHFLEDSYLKYVGWLLYDKQAEVRIKCINALLPLFEETDYVSRLELFLTKFKDRLVNMVMDKDIDVAVKTILLLTNVFRHFPSILGIKDCMPIYESVYASNRSLAVAAGEFLNQRVFQGSQNTEEEKRTLISDLILFYVSGEIHTHAAYLVDSLIDTAPIIKDWQTMVNMLMADDSDEYDTKLVEIMSATIKQAATGEPPFGRGGGKRVAKDNKLIHEDKIAISEVLIPSLPKLLSRHIADREKIANLMTIPQYFVLELYPTGRMMNYMDELMRVLERIVEQYSDDEILQNIATTLSYFKNNLAVSQRIEASKSQMIDNLAVQLRMSLYNFQQEGRMDEEDEASLLSGLRKFNAFAATEDLRKDELWDLCLALLNNSDKISNSQIPDKTIVYLFLALTWDIKRLLSDAENNVDDAAKKLKKKRDQLFNVIKAIITDSATGVENAFLCLCDMLILLNWKLESDFQNINITKLQLNLPEGFKNAINNFVVDNVFVSDDHDSIRNLGEHAQIELMAKRRNLLSQFCKLIIYGVLPISDASLVLRYYVKFYVDFGDLLKNLLVKCREMDRIACAKAIATALISAFEELRTSSKSGIVDPVEEDFIQLRDLAKRFAMSFGPDATRNRDAIATIHKYGILHALEVNQTGRRKNTSKSTNVAFLEVLIEFSPRLIKQDKLAVQRYLEKHCPVSPDILTKDDVWQPYLLYRGSLQDKSQDENVKSKGRTRKRTETTPTPSEFSMA